MGAISESIRDKLTLIVMAATGVVLVLSTLIFISNQSQYLRAAAIAEMRTLAKVIGANSNATLVFHDQATATEILSSLATKPQIIGAVIYNLVTRLAGGIEVTLKETD